MNNFQGLPSIRKYGILFAYMIRFGCRTRKAHMCLIFILTKIPDFGSYFSNYLVISEPCGL